MSGDPLTALEDWVAPLLAKLTPAERRSLARNVGQELRRSQATRIASQRNPDGSAFAPRKAGRARRQKGRIRRGMFAKLRTAAYLRVQANEQAASVGFVSRTARIAKVHQEGLRDEVVAGGSKYQYPARELLGLADTDRERIRNLVLEHLSERVTPRI